MKIQLKFRAKPKVEINSTVTAAICLWWMTDLIRRSHQRDSDHFCAFSCLKFIFESLRCWFLTNCMFFTSLERQWRETRHMHVLFKIIKRNDSDQSKARGCLTTVQIGKVIYFCLRKMVILVTFIHMAKNLHPIPMDLA